MVVEWPPLHAAHDGARASASAFFTCQPTLLHEMKLDTSSHTASVSHVLNSRYHMQHNLPEHIYISQHPLLSKFPSQHHRYYSSFNITNDTTIVLTARPIKSIRTVSPGKDNALHNPLPPPPPNSSHLPHLHQPTQILPWPLPPNLQMRLVLSQALPKLRERRL